MKKMAQKKISSKKINARKINPRKIDWLKRSPEFGPSWETYEVPKLEEELNRLFPKGDKARGRALVLYVTAHLEINELKKALEVAIGEIILLRKKLGYDKIKVIRRRTTSRRIKK